MHTGISASCLSVGQAFPPFGGNRQSRAKTVLRAMRFWGGVVCLAVAGLSSARAVNDLTVSSTTYGSGQTLVIDAVQTITTSGAVTVASGATVTYRAGARIELHPGFTVQPGAAFHAEIVEDLQSPTMPGELAATGITATGFTLNWAASTGPAGIAAYEVRCDSTSLGEAAATSRSITGLSANTTYAMSVRARDTALRWSAWSSALPVTTLPNPPPAPTASAGGLSAHGFTAGWTAAAGATGYRLDVSTNSAFSSYVPGYEDLDVGNATSRAVSGLAPNTTYYFRVRATNTGGVGLNSTTVAVTTLVSPPEPPVATMATGVTANGFTANWQPAAGATMYWTDISTSSSFSTYVFQNLGSDTPSRSVSVVMSGTTYYYRVRAQNAGGVSGYSNTVAVTPPVPTTFALSATTFVYKGTAQGPAVVPTPGGATFTTGGTLSAVNVGSYTATATATGSYSGSNSSLAWSIVQAEQTIHFPNPGTQLCATPLMLAATASSGLPVSYTLVSGPASLSGNTLTFTGRGSVTITASQPGNANYHAAASVTRTFAVVLGTQAGSLVIPFGSHGDLNLECPVDNYNFRGVVEFSSAWGSTTNLELWAGGVRFLSASGASDDDTMLTLTFSNWRDWRDTAPGRGPTVDVTLTVSGAPHLNGTVSNPDGSQSALVVGFSRTYTLDVWNWGSKRGPVVASGWGGSDPGAYGVNFSWDDDRASTTFTTNGPFAYDGTAKTVTITPSPAEASFTSGGVLTATNPGTYVATATATGSYSGSASLPWTISKGSQHTVISPNSSTVPIGQAVTFTASGGSGTGDYVWGGDASGRGPSKTVTFNQSGSRTVTVYREGDINYDPSPPVAATITVTSNFDPAQDSDGDGLPDEWEQVYFGNPTNGDPNADSDGDGLTNIAEYNLGSSPIVSNTGTSAVGGTVPAGWPNAAGSTTYAVGATSGSLHVDKSGMAIYSIPIWTTPGTSGLQPEVSLSYSSGGSNGIAGFGWSFSGASAITRGPQTLKIDGQIHGVDLTLADRFYLDGRRLILISGTYGMDGSEYRTEIDTFTKIVAYGARGAGPDHFKAWTKAGQIIEFGNTQDSAAEAAGQTEVMNWSANKVSDHAGNYMTFSYAEDVNTGEQLLTRIEYTGNASVLPYASLRFQYETRPDTFEGYYAGSKTAMTKRLKRIGGYYGETLARQFTLDYINRDIATGDGLGRSILTTVHEKDGTGTEYTPLTFEYSNPPNGWDAIDTNTWSPPVPLLSANIIYDTAGHAIYHAPADQVTQDATFIDIDGDGWPDCVRNFSVWLNKPSGWVLADGTSGRPDFRPSGMQTYARSARYADFNGDGLVDLMTDTGEAFINTGSGFARSEMWSLPELPPDPPTGRVNGGWLGGRFVDLNGDGWLDYLAIYQIVAYTDEYGNDHVETPTAAWLNRGPSASTARGSVWEYAPQYEGAALSAANGQFLADLNGDKLPDGVGSATYIDTIVTPLTVLSVGSAFLNSGNGFNWDLNSPYAPPTPFVINLDYFFGAWPTELVDLNGDGLVDIISRNEGLSALGDTNSAWFNTGKGWTPAPAGFHAPTALVAGQESATTGSIFLDLNNDGKIDFVRAFENANEVHLGTPAGWSNQDSSTWYLPRPVFLSASDINNNLQGITCKGAGSDMIDLNADGAVDQVWYWHQDYTWQHTGALEAKGAYVNKRVNPDRLTRITNGFGDSSVITYAPLTERDAQGNATVYVKGTDSTPGRPNVIAPIYVVKTIQVSDGVGGQKTSDYRYGGLRSDFVQGSLGFEWMRVTDNATGIVSESSYSQTYPFIGMPITETVKSGSVTLTEAVTAYDSKLLNGGLNRFVFAKDSTTTTHDLNGALIKTVATSVDPADIDAYGNVTRSITVTTGGFSKEVVSSYLAADTANWFISQTDRVVSTSRAPDTTDLTQTFSFTYETGTGLQKTVTMEPDTSTLTLTTTYGYDQFGNKISEELKGKALTVDNDGNYVVGSDTTRISTAQFDANGRFPIWRKNALDQQDSFDSYDQALGVLTQATDANNLTTSWAYDGFGRKIQEDHNVGTAGVIHSYVHYKWAPTGAPAGSKYFIETEADGAAPALAFFDTFGRIRHALSINGEGKIVYQSTAYDNLGRTTATSQPYFSGSSNLYWSGTAAGQFDALNRPLSAYTPDEEAPGGYVTTYFDYNGLTVTATSPNNHVLKTVKNELGQVVRSIRNADAATNAQDYTEVLYAYDALGNLVGTDAAGVITVVDYDIRGRKVSLADPDMGNWLYRYNVFGELIWQKDAKGQITRMGYDDLGRMISRVEVEGTTTWTYDTAAHGIGQLAVVTAPGGYSESHTYDWCSRPATVSRTIDATQYGVSQTYDSIGRPDMTTYPTGFQTRNIYNAFGVLKEVRRADSNRNDLYWMADSFAVTGQVNGEILGNGLANDRTYSPATGRLRSAAIGRGTEIEAPYSIQDLHYTYDQMANVLTRSDLPTNRSETFTYDGLERMRTNTLTGGVSSSLTVAYDQMGNLTNKSDLGDYAYNYTPAGRTSALPHAVSSAGPNSYTYDANGNMLTGNGRTLSWTSFNQVKRVDMTGGKFSEFSFGAAHERVKEVSHTGTTVFVGTLFEKVTGLGANPLVENKHYIFTPTGRVAVRTERSDNSVDTKYFHTDGLGSITVVTNEASTVLKRFAFDAWGRRLDPLTNQVITSATSGGLTRGYTDHEQLDDLGLVHMNGRVYDPMLARFLSSDPTVQSVSDSQTYNRYSYCSNNPLNKTDPTGFTAEGGSWWNKLWAAIKAYGNSLITPTGQGDGGTDSGGNYSDSTAGFSQLHGSILIYSINPVPFNGVSGVVVRERPGWSMTGKSKYVVVNRFVIRSVSSPKSDPGDSVREGLAATNSEMLIGIDGTGSSKWRHRMSDGSTNSNVFNMVNAFNGGARLYLNGPNTLGTNVRPIAAEAIAFIHAQLRANPNMVVNLLGHSRGGLIAIDIANRLHAGFADVNGGAPVRVNFLGLFDAVDRALGMDGSRIGNVNTVFHEIRDPAGRSRRSFGNTGLSADADVNYTPMLLMGTHSAIGGDPGHGDYQRTHIPLSTEMNTGAQAYQLMIEHAAAAGLPF